MNKYSIDTVCFAGNILLGGMMGKSDILEKQLQVEHEAEQALMKQIQDAELLLVKKDSESNKFKELQDRIATAQLSNERFRASLTKLKERLVSVNEVLDKVSPEEMEKILKDEQAKADQLKKDIDTIDAELATKEHELTRLIGLENRLLRRREANTQLKDRLRLAMDRLEDTKGE